MKTISFIALALFLGLETSFSFEISTVGGVSSTGRSADGKLIVFGGIAGKNCEASEDSSTCNNCSGELNACNPNRIHDKLNIKFTLNTNGALGTPALQIVNHHSGTSARLKGSSFYPLATNGTIVEFLVPWISICNVANQSIASHSLYRPTGCLRDFSLNSELVLLDPKNETIGTPIPLKIKLIGNNTKDFHSDCNDTIHPFGICDFSLGFRGGKIALNYLISHETFPAAPMSQFKYLHLFYSASSFEAVNLNSSRFVVSLGFNGTLNLSPTEFTPPQSGPQFFRAALEDEAGNLGYFTPQSLMHDDAHKVVINKN